jgi:hypothetical protein
MQKHHLIAAAVATAIASGYAVAQPALSSAAAPTVSLVIAGSSAAQPGISAALTTDICGTAASTLSMRSGASSAANKNFYAYSCNTVHDIPAAGGGTDIPSGTLITVWYRTEGGSVVGALPIAAQHNILRLDLTNSTCTASGATGTCTVTGVTATNGPSDSWVGAVTEDAVQLGVTDVEPSQLVGEDSPQKSPYGSAPASVAYKSSAFGAATATQMGNLSTVALYQQVFGLAVNTSGETFSSVDLDRSTAANILAGNITDWSKVLDHTTGAAVSSVSAPITVVNREFGSGTRTGANIYFFGYCQGGAGSSYISASNSLNYSTSDDVTATNATPGAITYTAIDQIQNGAGPTTYPNLVLAKIDGNSPSNLNAALGTYDYWFEATMVPNTTAIGTGNQAATLVNYLETSVPQLANAAHSPAVNVIPGYAGNTAAFPTPSNNGQTGTSEVYTSQYTRGGNSCAAPIEKY